MGAGGSKKKKKKADEPIAPLPESTSSQKTVDPRLPFTSYRQMFNTRNSWKAITRNMDETARRNLVFFFSKHPHHQQRFRRLKNMQISEDMEQNDQFDDVAMSVFHVFEDTVANFETLDKALVPIHEAGRFHGAIASFNTDFFKDMEDSFMESIKITLGDRFTEATENNFRLLYEFVTSSMIKEINSGASS